MTWCVNLQNLTKSLYWFLCRVLEQSLQETKAGTKRKRGDLWFVDPLNPHERKRDGNWSVGLKNVGNTCWFSAVVQVKIHTLSLIIEGFRFHRYPMQLLLVGPIDPVNKAFMFFPSCFYYLLTERDFYFEKTPRAIQHFHVEISTNIIAIRRLFDTSW